MPLCFSGAAFDAFLNEFKLCSGAGLVICVPEFILMNSLWYSGDLKEKQTNKKNALKDVYSIFMSFMQNAS